MQAQYLSSAPMTIIGYFLSGLIFAGIHYYFEPQFDPDISKKELVKKSLWILLLWPFYLMKIALGFLP